ncbi:MAG: hypothetical protein WCL44_13845 [bacterium]
MTNSGSFLAQYLVEIRDSYRREYKDNYDVARFGPAKKRSTRISTVCKTAGRRALLWVGLGKVLSVQEHMEEAFMFVAPWLQRLEKLYAQLCDDESKQTLVKVAAFRALGHRKVKLPFNSKRLWNDIGLLKHLSSTTDIIATPSVHTAAVPWELSRMDLSSLRIPITVYSVPIAVYGLFVAQEYRCPCLPKPVEADLPPSTGPLPERVLRL